MNGLLTAVIPINSLASRTAIIKPVAVARSRIATDSLKLMSIYRAAAEKNILFRSS